MKLDLTKEQILFDFKIAVESRECSLLGRREVLSGKAKFGIFGDGKEVAQVAMARSFKPGDWRAGYYRDQTCLMAAGVLSVRQFFAQLFADTSEEFEPHSAGRQMNNHPATRYISENGSWLSQRKTFNTSSDISPTGGQMPRLLGLAYASKMYKTLGEKGAKLDDRFTSGGQEVAFGTIGNASTSEGLFWETMNAAGVLQVPMVMSVWDDGYGISVPAKYQTTKESISKIMAGFQPEANIKGIEIFVVKGHDYETLVETYRKAATIARHEHRPVMVHVNEMTQPQGHSTSGSHERYKSESRLKWEQDADCIQLMRKWIINERIATETELTAIEQSALSFVESEKQQAWEQYLAPLEKEKSEALEILQKTSRSLTNEALQGKINQLINELIRQPVLLRRQILATLRRSYFHLSHDADTRVLPLVNQLKVDLERYESINQTRYSSHLFHEGPRSPLHVQAVPPTLTDKSERVDGRQVIQKFFETRIQKDPRIFICGEDVGQLGGVNLEFDGLQAKFGEHRVTDTGIREATILGQCFGAAMRGLRPIADIQYLDYLLYCFQGLSDDVATLHYRTKGVQAAPLIIRTKGHRLEGIWHTGSPLGMLINGIRGIHVCVPRNMTQAAGMYATLLDGDDPGLVIEVLNGYRQKEILPDNIDAMRVPLGVPEVLYEGTDVTIVTYGACIRVAQEAMQLLKNFDISVELIDCQTLLPFDRPGIIRKSLEKTSALICLDEDVPGGASAYMMQQILVAQNSFELLDLKPMTISAKDHRSAYASDGDYFSKPNAEDIFETIYQMMHERQPDRWPHLRNL
jgi:2-oxoisovalerate dehydrogenase E1 component